MRYPAHAATGYSMSSGIVAAIHIAYALTGVLLTPVVCVLIIAGGGAATIPDIDHAKSFITQSGGTLVATTKKTLNKTAYWLPAEWRGTKKTLRWIAKNVARPIRKGGVITPLISKFLRWVSRRVYAATRLPCDPPTDVNSGEHRGFLHSWPAALTVGILVAALWSTGIIGQVLVLMALLPLGIRSAQLPGRNGSQKARSQALVSSIALTGLYIIGTNIGAEVPWWLAGLVIGSCTLTHDIGDGFTQQGWPMMWPFATICERCKDNGNTTKCRRWERRCNLPQSMRFTTGSPVEGAIATVSYGITAFTIIGTIGAAHYLL